MTTPSPHAPLEPMPHDWQRGLVLVAHPDDPEYGMSAAVARWTSEGKDIAYVLASSGEAGIEGLDRDEAGPLREDEQRRSAAVVGVSDVEFLGFPDSRIVDSEELRAAVVDAIRRHEPQLVLVLFGGPEFAPGHPNQSDHLEFAKAVVAGYDELTGAAGGEARDDAAGEASADPGWPRWLFESSTQPTHLVTVAGFVEAAVASLAEHDRYLSVLDPQTPVVEQARAQVEQVVAPKPGSDGQPAVGFTLLR